MGAQIEVRHIRPVCDSEPVELGHEALMAGLRVVVVDWSLSLTEAERDGVKVPSPCLWWAEVCDERCDA